MSETVGFIYVLSNKAMPDWIKIGYADSVEERVSELNRLTAIPFSFVVRATYAVPKRLADKQVHAIIDQLRPELRAVDIRDGGQRKREFYAMSVDDAVKLLMSIAAIHGFEDRVRIWQESPEDKANDSSAEKALAAKAKREAFRFSMAGIKPGEEISFVHDAAKRAVVLVDDKRVRYNGEVYSLSSLAQVLMGKDTPLQGPLYFTYNGELLTDLRRKLAEE